MQDNYVDDLLHAHDIVTMLKMKNQRASYGQQFTVVLNAINEELVTYLKACKNG